MKKLAAILSASVLSLSIIPAPSYAEDSSSMDFEPSPYMQANTETPKDYINFLKSLTPETQSSFSAPNEPKDVASEFLTNYQSLSQEDQQKFLDYLNDPAYLKALYESSQDNSNVTLYNGDIQIRQENVTHNSGGKFSTAAVNYSSRHNIVSEIFGLEVFRVETYVNYRAGGTSTTNLKVQEILSDGGFVAKNFVPGLSISITQEKAYTSADQKTVYKTVHYHWNFVHKSLGLLIGTDTHTVWGNARGQTGHSLSKTPLF